MLIRLTASTFVALLRAMLCILVQPYCLVLQEVTHCFQIIYIGGVWFTWLYWCRDHMDSQALIWLGNHYLYTCLTLLWQC